MKPSFLRNWICFWAIVPVLAFGGISLAHAQQPERTVSDYGIPSDEQLDWEGAGLDLWLSRLNEIELLLHHESIAEDVRLQALNDLDQIGQAATIQRKEEQARLEPIEKEIASLGPEPGQGEAPEPEELAKLRADVRARLSVTQARISELQLVLARIENLELALITHGEAPAIERLWIRSPILWHPRTWEVAADHWLTLMDSVVEAPAEWWESRSGTPQPTKLLLAAGAGLAALLLGVPVRRWLRRRVRRGEDERDPSYAWRIYAAFATAVAEVLLPSLALGAVAGAIWLLPDDDTLLAKLAIAVCRGGVVYFVLTGLARAVLAPQAPAWRVVPVTEEGAVELNRRIGVVALYVAIADILFNIATYLNLLESPEFAAVTTLFLDGALAVLLLSLLPSHFWHSEDDDDGPSKVLVAVSIVLGALLVATPILDLIGFSELASRLLLALIVTVVAIGFTFLLRLAGREAWNHVLRPGGTIRLRLLRWFRLGDGGARSLRMLGHLSIDVILFSGLAYGLLRFYGLPNALIRHWLRAFADGVTIGDVVLTPVNLIVAVLVFAAILLATGMMRRWLSEKLRVGTRLDLGVRNAIVSGIGYGGVVLAVLVAIAMVGLDLSNLALVAGALSVGVGFGLRTVVENFVAGLLLLIERPIKEGDWIVTAGFQGTVKRISVRSTEIETFDRASVIVPNAELIAQPVQNWTHKNRMARVIVPVGVAYGSDTEKVRKTLLACAEEHDLVQRYPPPEVLFQQFGESSLGFELRCFVRDTDYFLSCKSDLNFAIDKAFREAGIEVPFPQRDLHLRDGLPLLLGGVADRPDAQGKVVAFPEGTADPPQDDRGTKAEESKKTD